MWICFEAYPVDGIILVGTVLTRAHKKKLKECKVPIVVIGQYTKETSCVYHDDYGAAKALAEQVGREASGRVAYIGVTREDKAAGAAREDGFREGLKEVGKELEESCLRRAKSPWNQDMSVQKSFCSQTPLIDSLICATDTMAVGGNYLYKGTGAENSAGYTGCGNWRQFFWQNKLNQS